ncbi:hypothetical protein N0V84_001412 [Fusarium piperis]|uniref:Uncharacterized protein n=1 Tax=Fusarium piperis TaxID=1435070 RepID=A0A9W8WLG7_9HYPO|nr:hypothetical protein N0V84_001412 [Fusarium piperis]
MPESTRSLDGSEKFALYLFTTPTPGSSLVIIASVSNSSLRICQWGKVVKASNRLGSSLAPSLAQFMPDVEATGYPVDKAKRGYGHEAPRRGREEEKCGEKSLLVKHGFKRGSGKWDSVGQRPIQQ